MLKALGILGKKKPAKEEQIERHKEQSAIHDQWKKQVEELQAVTSVLWDEYAKCKEDFAISRYEELKAMIKTAIKKFRQLEEEHKKRARSASALRAESATKEESGKKTGAITRLRLGAQGFANNQEELCQKEKDYSEMTAKEVDADLDHIRKSTLQLKQDYYNLRDRLERLANGYEDSKKHNPTQRYNLLKNMIKQTVKPS